MNLNDLTKKAIIDAIASQMKPLEESLAKMRKERNETYENLGITVADVLRLRGPQIIEEMPLPEAQEPVLPKVAPYRYYKAASRSGESNGHQIIWWSDGNWSCNCPAGEFGRQCWAVKEAYKSGASGDVRLAVADAAADKVFGQLWTGWNGMSKYGYLTPSDAHYPVKLNRFGERVDG